MMFDLSDMTLAHHLSHEHLLNHPLPRPYILYPTLSYPTQRLSLCLRRGWLRGSTTSPWPRIAAQEAAGTRGQGRGTLHTPVPATAAVPPQAEEAAAETPRPVQQMRRTVTEKKHTSSMEGGLSTSTWETQREACFWRRLSWRSESTTTQHKSMTDGSTRRMEMQTKSADRGLGGETGGGEEVRWHSSAVGALMASVAVSVAVCVCIRDYYICVCNLRRFFSFRPKCEVK